VRGGIAQLFLNLGTRRGGGCGQHHAPTAFTPGKDPVPIVQEAGWAPGAGLDRCGKSRTTGIRSPDFPARSKSLYRLRYPGSRNISTIYIYIYIYI
jgi:hypothetical protein